MTFKMLFTITLLVLIPYIVSAAIEQKTGLVRPLAIIVDYPDKPLEDNENTLEHWEEIFNGTGTWDEDRRSLRGAYLDQSYNKIDVTTKVLWPPYRMSRNFDAYNENTKDQIWEAIQHYDPTFDFSEYDGDGDGSVDVLMFIHSAYGPPDHKGCCLNEIADGVSFQDLVWQAIYSPWPPMGPGLSSHEFSHVIGVPDFYDYNSVNGGSGKWMGGEVYYESVWKPEHIPAPERMELGWIRPTVLTRNAVGLKAYPSHASDSAFYKIPIPGADSSEFFTLQSVVPESYNKNLPMEEGGLLIWHYDGTMGNNTVAKGTSHPRDPNSHCRARVMEADGRDDIWFKQNVGEQSDLFYPGNLLSDGVFGPHTTPAALSYYDTQTRNFTVTVTDFTDGVVTFDIEFDPLAVTGITISESEITILKGDSMYLRASVLPVAATDSVILWESSDVTIVSIDSTGTIAGLSGGVAEIYGTTRDGAFEGTIVVTVDGMVPEALVEDIEVSGYSDSGFVDLYLDGSLSITPNGEIEEYIWIYEGGVVDSGVGPQVSLPYGEHALTLEVADSDGRRNSTEFTVTVLEVFTESSTESSSEYEYSPRNSSSSGNDYTESSMVLEKESSQGTASLFGEYSMVPHIQVVTHATLQTGPFTVPEGVQSVTLYTVTGKKLRSISVENGVVTIPEYFLQGVVVLRFSNPVQLK
ncbi:MAG: Ig-like domain-containing protein [Fibrobacterales bacterium]